MDFLTARFGFGGVTNIWRSRAYGVWEGLCMNTPRTRPPKRYKAKVSDTPDGGYASGIDNPIISEKIGYLITYWPHIEEHMVAMFKDLMGISARPNCCKSADR